MAEIDELLAIMARLRDPERGCPWDVKQDFASIAPYTIEEAYEVADAIQRGDMADLRDELGDLLLQVVFHARMAEEAGHFAFADVVRAIRDKMLRRHPHVFSAAERAVAGDPGTGEGADVADAQAQLHMRERMEGISERLLDISWYMRERGFSGSICSSILTSSSSRARRIPIYRRPTPPCR